MAKRRNLKKEKALRNEAYAKKFRKRNQKNRRRRMGGQSSSSDNANTNEDSSADMGGAADI